jgi:hypothetical protein
VRASTRRWRRKSGRTEFVAIRTFPEIKDLITQIADEPEKHLGEVVEDAVRLLTAALRTKLGSPLVICRRGRHLAAAFT